MVDEPVPQLLRFQYPDGELVIEHWQATMENPYYHAAIKAFRPQAIAAEAGKLDDVYTRRIIAVVYAEGVVKGSPTAGYTDWTPKRWTQWLLDHPVEFEHLQERADPEYGKDMEDGGGIEWESVC